MPGTLLQAFPFVHPGLAAVALGTGLIPVLVHLINRRRYARMPWAAMSFLLAANRRSTRRVRLEQALLLLTRIALIVLLGLAIARPYVPAGSLLPARASRAHRVIMLDNSLSMNAETRSGETRFDIAKRFASSLLESFPSTDAVSIVTLASPAEAVIAEGVYDRRFVKERLAAVEQTQRGTDPVGALTRTAALIEASEVAEGNRTVYLLSDFTRSDWLSELSDEPTPAVRALRRLADRLKDSAVDLTLVHTGTDNPPNLAITNLVTRAPLVGVQLPTRIQAVVVNRGVAVARNAAIQIRRDGRIIRRQQLPPLEPGESAAVTVSVEFSTPGTHLIDARLTPSETATDALPDDNARYLSLEVRESTPVLLVDGRPETAPLGGQTGFLATALSPGRLEAKRDLIAPKVVTEPELAGEALLDYDAVALCNVERLSAEMWTRLETYVARGAGLMIFAGDRVNVDHYNRYGHGDGSGLLPGRFGRASAAPGNGDAQLGFRLDEPAHAMVAEFSEHPESGLFASRVDRYLPTELDPSRSDVVLSYTNGDPALVSSSYGRGTVLLWTTTANMDWTNLPAKGDYVSIMLNAMAALSPRHGDHRNITVGDRLREPLTPAETALPLRVTTGLGNTAEPALVPDGEGLALSYGPVERAQGITASIGTKVRAFAANIDPAESELLSATAEALTATIGRPVRMIDDPAGGATAPVATRSVELASLALYAVVLLLWLEMWMARVFVSQRGRGPASKR
jgi:hypothetical protein